MRIPAGAPIVTAAAMRAAEAAVFAAGVPQDKLMERAGVAVAREAARFAMGRRVLVLAGPGNNGGDAYVAARHLQAGGLDVTVAALGEPKAGSAAAMRAQWEGRLVPFSEAKSRLMLVDGLFGTGLTRALDGAVADKLQALVAAADFSLAIDLPSGLGTDDAADFGAPRGISATLALGALKPAHLLAAGLARTGDVLLADIGIPVAAHWRTIARPRLSAPALDAHKYTRGYVLVLAGAMPGAARLAARAALASGAGYVAMVRGGGEGPDALVHIRPADMDDLRARMADERIGAVLIGPGLGRDARAEELLDAALACGRPLVLDGDALSLLGTDVARRLDQAASPIWLTPHAGEFERMFGSSTADKVMRTLTAARNGATVLHKGPDTVIADAAGEVRLLAGASRWLSTAGTGDVLSGILAARVAVGGKDAVELAADAAWLHARTAQLAGPAFHADQLIEHLPAAVAECL